MEALKRWFSARSLPIKIVLVLLGAWLYDPLRLELARPLDELEDQLLKDLAGRELTMLEIYEEHSVGKPFLKHNYKRALWNLYERGAISASPEPRKHTFADHISASFPAR